MIQKIRNQLKEKVNLNVILREKSTAVTAIPLALKQQYRFYAIEIEGVSFLGVYVQKIEMTSLKKHLKLFGDKTHSPILLIVESLSTPARRYLIENRISFISEEAIYLPRLLVYLEEAVQKKSVSTEHKKLSKSAQQLIITAIIEGKSPLESSFVMERLQVSKMSASRVLNELAAFDFVTVQKQGRQKYYTPCIRSLDTLLSKMRTPLMQAVYINPSAHSLLPSKCKAGYSALSYYTNITTQSQEIAIEKKWFEQYREEKALTIYDLSYEQDFVKVELWRYPPLPCRDEVVDPFSLYLSLADTIEDERTQNAVDTLYTQLHRMIDDTRD